MPQNQNKRRKTTKQNKMIQPTQLDLHSFKEAVKNTETFIKIGNTPIQKLYFNLRTLDRLYENYRQGFRYGIDYLRQKPSLQSRDVRIIGEILGR